MDGQKRAGITINSFASVSLDPPLVLFSANRALNSFPIFERAQGFAINILRGDQADLSARFARAGGDKWNGVDSRDGQHGGIIIQRSLASFDCKVFCRYDGGDHMIFIGEVVGVATGSTASDHSPLVYFGSKYRQLASPQAMLSAA